MFNARLRRYIPKLIDIVIESKQRINKNLELETWTQNSNLRNQPKWHLQSQTSLFALLVC